MDNLITDRTLEDVNEMKAILNKIKQLGDFDELTNAEKLKFNTLQSKGSYDYVDFNRVNEWVAFISNNLNTENYRNVVNTKTDWSEEDIVTLSDTINYLNNINVLREAFYVKSDTPDTPIDLKNLSYDEANAIEQILFDINDLYNKMFSVFRYCDTFNCGDGLEELD